MENVTSTKVYWNFAGTKGKRASVFCFGDPRVNNSSPQFNSPPPPLHQLAFPLPTLLRNIPLQSYKLITLLLYQKPGQFLSVRHLMVKLLG
jgi:hypothetical protein